MHPTPDFIRRRILDVCLVMENDLSYPFTIGELADLSGLSRYHFQRQFRRVVGETPMGHLRRLRLSRAALFLKNSDAPITQVALESGFSTHAGFTHAFVKAYGVSPQAFRANHLVRPYLRLPPAPAPVDAAALAACPLTVTIEKMPSRRVALMRYVGPTRGMASIWRPMSRWCRRRGLLREEGVFLGIHHDDWHPSDPESYAGYRYDAAVEVNVAFEPDDEVCMTIVPGGEVATVSARGSVARIDQLWRIFAEQWLPASGYQPRLSVFFDIYPGRLIAGRAFPRVLSSLRGVEARLCIPVTRLPVAFSAPDA